MFYLARDIIRRGRVLGGSTLGITRGSSFCDNHVCSVRSRRIVVVSCDYRLVDNKAFASSSTSKNSTKTSAEQADFREQLSSLSTSPEFRKNLVAATSDVSINPPLVVDTIKESVELIDSNRVDEAISKLEEIIKKNAYSAELHCSLGYAYRAKNQPNRARKSFNAALRQKKAYSDAYQGLGLLSLAEGDLYTAKLHFFDALEASPKHVAVHVTLGNIFMKEGKLDTAKEYFQKAIDINPSVDTIIYLSEVYGLQGKLEEAKNLIDQAITNDPNFGGAHVTLVAVLIELKNYEIAKVHINKAWEIWNNEHLKKIQKGMPLDERLAKLGEMIYQKGRKLINENQFQEAEELAKLATLLLPERVDPLLLNAGINLKTNNFAHALQITGRILDKHPKHFEANILMASILQTIGKKNESMGHLLMARSSDPVKFQQYIEKM